MFKPLQQSHRLAWLLGLTIALGALLFLWRLGAVGQLDETLPYLRRQGEPWPTAAIGLPLG